MTIDAPAHDATAQARTLVQSEVCLGSQCFCSLPIQTTPTPGLAIIPQLGPNADNPALGVSASYTGWWAVLHLASGHTVTAALPDPAQAHEQARLLGKLPIDWTAPAETIQAVDQQTRKKVVQTWVAAYAFHTESQEHDNEY